MSNPVTNVEIEDVLSSIRRLVSSDDRSVRPASGDTVRDADRLVLTPSLRIDDGEDGASADDGPDANSQVNDDAQAVGKQTEMDAEKDGASLSDQTENPENDDLDTVEDDQSIIAESDAEVADSISEADSFDQDLANAVNDVTTDDFAESDADQSGDSREEADQDAEVDSDETANRLVAQPWFRSDRANKDMARQGPGHSDLGARVAEFEKFVAARDDEWEPDGASDDAYAGSSVSPLPWHDQLSDQEDEALEDTDADAQEEVTGAESLTAADNAAGAVSTDDAEAAEAVQIVDEQSNEHDSDKVFPLILDEPVMDEDALRDLVSEIVRQELQGALGERITRNVRKLVRREIHRALTSQELE